MASLIVIGALGILGITTVGNSLEIKADYQDLRIYEKGASAPAIHKVPWEHPEPYGGIIDRIMSAFGFGWLYKKSDTLKSADEFVNNAPGRVSKFTGEQVGEFLTEWLKQIFSSPLAIAVGVALVAGLVIVIGAKFIVK